MLLECRYCITSLMNGERNLLELIKFSCNSSNCGPCYMCNQSCFAHVKSRQKNSSIKVFIRKHKESFTMLGHSVYLMPY